MSKVQHQICDLLFGLKGEMNKNNHNMKMQTKEVIFFPLPEAGHINPMFHVAEALHSKGMSITFILTKYKSPNPSNFPPDYTFHFMDDGLDAAKLPLTEPVAVLNALLAGCREPFKECMAAILGQQQSSKRSVACLITDPVWKFARPVCEELKLPRITLHTSTAADMVILSSPDAYQHKEYSLFPEVIEMVNEIRTSCALICNSFEELEGPSLKALRQNIPHIPIFPIGPLHKHSTTSVTSSFIEDKTQITSWLDNQAPKSVLYVSFGTLATINKDELDEIAWGLANSNQPFLWVVRNGLVRDGSEQSELLPEGFLDATRGRGLIVTWAPQQEVLAHDAIGGAFVHGGWNSTLESIVAGVPIICMPCLFPDQKTIAMHVSEIWRTGLHIQRGVKREEVENAVRTIMVGDDGDEIRARAKTFKNVASNCLEEGGSSYQSLERLSSFILSL